jgi:DNA-directed RNA polymerase specialized sigma24 family protein
LVLDLKYALGLSDRETADAIGIKLRTTQRILADARQWLSERADLDYQAESKTMGR